MILSEEFLSKMKINSRNAKINLIICEARKQLINLIDEFWRYYKDPENYVYMTGLDNDGNEQYSLGVWLLSEALIYNHEGATCIRIPFGNTYLPLTESGDTELYIYNPSLEYMEEIMAQIRYAILSGCADDFFTENEGLQNVQENPLLYPGSSGMRNTKDIPW